MPKYDFESDDEDFGSDSDDEDFYEEPEEDVDETPWDDEGEE